MKRHNLVRIGLSLSLVVGSTLATASMAVAGGGSPAPANDDIASAAAISTASTLGSTVGSNDQGSEYKSGDAQFNSSVWYYWVASANESVTISSCNSVSSTHLNVYTETEVGYPTVVVPTASPAVASTSCTRGDTVTFTSVNTKRYYVQVLTTNGGEGAFTVTVSTTSTPANTPATPLDRITICHRTHATTNPYRIITVSTSSIVKADSTANGHGEHNSKRTRTNDGIFNPPYAKPSLKYWGDIIPPFTASNGGTFAGMNWKWGALSDAALADGTLSKTEFKAIDAVAAASGGTQDYEKAGLQACQGASAELTSKQLFDLERKNGQSRKDILDEVKELDALETETVNKEATDLEKELPAKEGPKNEPTNVPDQSLAGVVWLDLNENGFQEDNEPDMPNISVTIGQTDPALALGLIQKFKGTTVGHGVSTAAHWMQANVPFASGLLEKLPSVFHTATTYKVTTDANGSYLFKSIGAGDWTVVGVVPAGLGVTYDSSGISDASVDATVPVSGFAFTWVGLVGKSGIKAPVTNPDGTPVTKQVVLSGAGPDGKFCTADDVNYIIDPVNGEIVVNGIPAGEYRIDSIGGKNTLGTFTVAESTYSSKITTKFGTKCPNVDKAGELADTGISSDLKPYGLVGIALLLLVGGGLGIYRSRRLS